jgi:hypothetical protein
MIYNLWEFIILYAYFTTILIFLYSLHVLYCLYILHPNVIQHNMDLQNLTVCTMKSMPVEFHHIMYNAESY